MLRRLPLFRPLLLCALVLAGDAALADLIPLKWDARGEFAKSVEVKPGKFVEICDGLQAGAQVDWHFKADAALEFNIHFHEGKNVRYPVQRDQASSDEGVLQVAQAQDYCWMWVNKGSAPTTMALRLRRR